MNTLGQETGWAAIWRDKRFTLLLAVLVVDILIAPAVGALGSARHPNLGTGVMLLALTAVVVTSFYATRQAGRSRLLPMVLGIVMMGLAWVDLVTEEELIFQLSQVFAVAFLAWVVTLLVRHVFSEKRVTLDVVNASLCAYLMIGLGWAAAYSLIEMWEPGSFRVSEDGTTFASQTLDGGVRRVYFSFVTMLTLGYGEIVPTGSLARMSAVMEAFVGQIFIVVLVARLVGIHVGQEMMGGDDSE